MKVSTLKATIGGWFIGNFDRAAFRTSEFEVGIARHAADSCWPQHYHAVATEINCLLRGEMTICGQTLKSGDVFIIEPNELADPVFHTDCEVVVVKVPSLPGDKYVVD